MCVRTYVLFTVDGVLSETEQGRSEREEILSSCLMIMKGEGWDASMRRRVFAPAPPQNLINQIRAVLINKTPSETFGIISKYAHKQPRSQQTR